MSFVLNLLDVTYLTHSGADVLNGSRIEGGVLSESYN